MKRSLQVLGTWGVLGAAATTAHAQSSVTLYGLIDTSLVYSNSQKGPSNIQTSSGTLSGIRSTGRTATAALWPITASSTSHQFVAALGLRHKF